MTLSGKGGGTGPYADVPSHPLDSHTQPRAIHIDADETRLPPDRIMPIGLVVNEFVSNLRAINSLALQLRGGPAHESSGAGTTSTLRFPAL